MACKARWACHGRTLVLGKHASKVKLGMESLVGRVDEGCELQGWSMWWNSSVLGSHHAFLHKQEVS
ncbi:hypothetical protein Csa_023324 [Cucumis sativus]|nr:hypothetical protein Csa_023324 [Cucumis sativus]